MMAIRLNPERVLGLTIFVLFPIWAFLTATGCAAKTVVKLDKPAVVSRETASTSTAPVSTRDVHGDQTNINMAGGTPWTIAGLWGLLWAFQAWRQRTATGALDRVVQAIKTRDYGLDTEALERLKETIALDGSITTPDRQERFIRKRLARMKKNG